MRKRVEAGAVASSMIFMSVDAAAPGGLLFCFHISGV